MENDAEEKDDEEVDEPEANEEAADADDGNDNAAPKVGSSKATPAKTAVTMNGGDQAHANEENGDAKANDAADAAEEE